MGKFLKKKKKSGSEPEVTKKVTKTTATAETTTKPKSTTKAPEKATKKAKKGKSTIDRRTLPKIVSKSAIFPRIEVAHKECGSAQVSRGTIDRLKALAEKEGCRVFDITEKFLTTGLDGVKSKKPKD